jgi:hypothetical protein
LKAAVYVLISLPETGGGSTVSAASGCTNMAAHITAIARLNGRKMRTHTLPKK